MRLSLCTLDIWWIGKAIAARAEHRDDGAAQVACGPSLNSSCAPRHSRRIFRSSQSQPRFERVEALPDVAGICGELSLSPTRSVQRLLS